MKKQLVIALSLVLVMILSLTACSSSTQVTTTQATTTESAPTATTMENDVKAPYKIATVVKILGISWFDRSNEGLTQFGKDNGVETFMVGPEKLDSAIQVNIVEDLIAQEVDAICIIPISAEAMEPVLKKAREAGIVVISHEGSNLKNVDFDLEAFDNKAYGEHLMSKLGEQTNGQGEYAQFVATLTSTSHNEWCDAAESLQKEKYPDMKLVTARLEENENNQEAYDKTRELLTKYPNLKAIQSSSMGGTAAIALAIEDMGLQDQVSLVGTSLVSVAGQYLTTEAADMISFWDPAKAAYAMNKLAYLTLEGKASEIVDDYDLGVEGYNKLVKDGSIVYGSAWIDATKENMADYNF